MSISLYEMKEQYQQLLETDVDPTREDTEAWNELMAELQDDIEVKAVHIGYVIRTLQYEVDTLAAHKKDIDQRMKVRKNKIARLKAYLFEQMKATGTKRAEAVDIKVLIAKTPMALTLVDEDNVPDEYWRVRRELNRADLLKHVKANPDCEFAHAESGEAVRIS